MTSKRFPDYYQNVIDLRAKRASIREIAKAIGKSQRHVVEVVRQLRDAGLIDWLQEPAYGYDETAAEERIAVYDAVRRCPDDFGPRTAQAIAQETKIPVEKVRDYLGQLAERYHGARLIEPVKGEDCVVTWRPIYKPGEDEGRPPPVAKLFGKPSKRHKEV